MLIYNFVSIDAPTWKEYIDKMLLLVELYPLKNALWMPFIIIIQQKILYKICIWLGHLFPAFLIDAVNICMNRRPRYCKCVSVIFIIICNAYIIIYRN